MTAKNLCVPVAVAVLVAGCASKTDLPLIFGTSNTIGISIGGSVAEQGGDFTIGYKGQDFALVPVSVHQPDGTEKQIGMEVGADKDRFSDAFSVLGQFSASAARSEKTAPRASLGKFFATGLAAKTLSEGFAKKLGKDRTAPDGCSPKPPTPQKNQQQAPQKNQQQAPAAPRPTGSPAAEGKRGGALMFFGQYTALAFSLGGGAPQQGMDFILGWKDRNLAIVPVIERGADGNASQIQSQASNQRDALSVLGQFEFDTREDAGAVEAGLGKFFATGGAARQLSDGFRVRLCEEYVPKQAKSDGPSTGSASQ